MDRTIISRKNTAVVTGTGTRMSYVNVNTPKEPLGGGKPKYSVSLLIPKSDTVTLDKVHAAIQAAYEQGEGILRGTGQSVPPLDRIRTPLRDGDQERPDDPAYRGYFFINASSTFKPEVVDEHCNEILDSAEIYSGIYGRASISFFAYNHTGNRGIGCGLRNLQKLADGEPLGGRSRAADDFASTDDSNDDDGFLS